MKKKRKKKKKKLKKPKARSALPLLARMRHAGPMKPKLEPRGGSKNLQQEYLKEAEET